MNIRDLRRGIMVMVNSTDKLQNLTQKNEGKTSRELSLVKTKMQEAMMWSGNFLKYAKLGDNPYAENDGKRKTVADIKPLFDATSETIDAEFFTQGQIVVVDQMRQYFSSQIDAFMDYVDSDEFNEQEFTEKEEMYIGLCIVNLLTKMSEARMWLGMELGRIRDTQ